MAGRKPISELERLRRAALRKSLLLQSLKAELEESGDNINEIRSMDTPGRRPRARSEIFERETQEFMRLIRTIKAQERELGVKRLNMNQVRDPLVLKGTISEVGRKKNSDVDFLDKALRAECEKFRSTRRELKENKGYDVLEIGVVLSATGKRMGRAPKLFSERFAEHKGKITELLAGIASHESELDSIGLIDRQIKIFRDYKRVKKMREKEGQNVSKWPNHSFDIDLLLVKKKQIERDIVYKKVDHNSVERIELFRPLQHEVDTILDEIDDIKIKVRK